MAQTSRREADQRCVKQLFAQCSRAAGVPWRAMLLDPRNGQAYDLPPTARPRRMYVVASTPRTGSTLLCRSLWDTGLAGAPKEYLNPMQLRDWEVRLGSWTSVVRHRMLSGAGLALIGRLGWDEERLDEHLARVMDRRTGADGWFGMKLHAHHHRQWFAAHGLEERHGPVRWIRIHREDRLAQAISWERALQTGRWASHQDATRVAPRYSRAAINRRLVAIDRDERWWDDHLDGREVLAFSYERLVRNRAVCVREALRWLGIEGASGVGLREAALERQADAVSVEWARRYHAGE